MKLLTLALCILGTASTFASFDGTYIVQDSSECKSFQTSSKFPIYYLNKHTEVDLNLMESREGYACSSEDMYGVLNITTFTDGTEQREKPLYKNSCSTQESEYHKQGKYTVKEDLIAFESKGSRTGRCELFAGLTYPCSKSWNQSWSLKKSGNKLIYNYNDEGKKGTCILTQKR